MAKKLSCNRFVDMWLMPSMHPTNIELLQKLKSADDLQFGKNMDVVGSISDKNLESGEWEKTHVIGLRSDLWSPDEKEISRSLKSLHRNRRDELRKEIKRAGRLNDKQQQQLKLVVDSDSVMETDSTDLEIRRLVLKMFKTNTKRMRWEGTLEELTASEVHNTLGSKRPLLSMAVILPGHDYLNYVQQNHRTFRVPSLFTFCFHDEKRNHMWHIAIKRKWVSIGADFTIEVGEKQIGLINGQLIGFGYNAYITLDDHPLAKCPDFLDLLTLFTSSVGYHRGVRKSIRRRVRAIKSNNQRHHVLEDEEMGLRKNPRSRAA